MTTDPRQQWIDAVNALTEARKRFMDANKEAPLRDELDRHIAAEKAARKLYEQAYGRTTNERNDMSTEYVTGEGWSEEDGRDGMFYVMLKGEQNPDAVEWFESKAKAQKRCDKLNGSTK